MVVVATRTSGKGIASEPIKSITWPFSAQRMGEIKVYVRMNRLEWTGAETEQSKCRI